MVIAGVVWVIWGGGVILAECTAGEKGENGEEEETHFREIQKYIYKTNSKSQNYFIVWGYWKI